MENSENKVSCVSSTNDRINVNHFLSAVVLSRLSSVLLFTPITGFGISASDRIIGEAAATFIIMLISVPLYREYQKHGNFPLFSSKGVKIVSIILTAYFALWLVLGGAIFSYFASTQLLEGDISQSFFILTAIIAIYGSYVGAQSIGRCSLLLFTAAGVGIIVMLILSMGNFTQYNLTPALQSKTFSILEYTAFSVVSSTEIIAGCFMAGETQAFKGRNIRVWYGIALFFSFVLPLFSAGLFGDLANSLPFPTFKITSSGNYVLFSRLDAVFSFIWIAAFCVKLTLIFYSMKICLSGVFCKTNIGITLILPVTALVLLSLFFATRISIVPDKIILLILLVAFLFALTAVYLPIFRRKKVK